MRVIRQQRTSIISVKTFDRTDESGLFIQQSAKARTTEIEALSHRGIHDSGIAVTDAPSHKDDCFCSLCGWRPKNRFYTNPSRKSGCDNYCKDCRSRIRKIKVISERLTT